MRKRVYVILGQTATGKSDLAVELAKKIGGEVISADSRQVYKGLDIGTGKVTKKEMRGVPHHLIDVASPRRKFTVASYKKLAEKKIAEVVNRGKTPVICGGTGFYINALTKGILFPEVPPNPGLRRLLGKKSNSELLGILRKYSPSRAKAIDPNNKVRLIRAIEVAKALGRVPPIMKVRPSFDFVKIGLYLPPEKLRKNVDRRVKNMFKKGLLREIEGLKKAGISDKRLREFGFEYYQPTPEKVISETLKYAKRQMTWFKRDKDIKWFDASAGTRTILGRFNA